MKNVTKKLLTVTLCVLLVLCVVASFAACTKAQHTLTFVTNGATQIAPITAAAGESIVAPADPVREGYVFDGWYTSADFSGSSVTIPSVMPDEDVTYYAKFSASTGFTLTLDPTQYGTLAKTEYTVNAGDKLADVLASAVPTGVGDAVFACWYNSGAPISANATMPKRALTLTAKYTVDFTVEAYKQQLDGTFPIGGEAVSLSDDITGGKYVGDTIDASDDTFTLYKYDSEGFEFSDKTTALTLGTTASENVYRLYYTRKAVYVRYDPNLPQGASASALKGDTVDDNSYMAGGTAVVKQSGYTLEGYRFAGWSLTKNGQITVLPDDTDATITLGDKSTTLYANWNLGTTDIDGGSDKIFVLKEKANTVVLQRFGLEDKEGTYNPDDRKFTFTNGDEVLLQGRITSDGTRFAYLNEEFANRTFTKYDWQNDAASADEGALVTDGMSGATYTYKRNGKTVAVEGEYTANGSLYVFEPLDYTKGSSFNFRLDTDNNRMLVRDETHNATYYTLTVSGDETQVTFPIVVTDGFGSALYYGSQLAYEMGVYTAGTYTLTDKDASSDEEAFDFTASDGKETIHCRVLTKYQRNDAYVGAFVAADGFRGEYKFDINGNTRTLTLDGYGTATYTDSNLSEVTNEATYGYASAPDGGYYIYYVNTASNVNFALYINGDVAKNVGTEVGYYSQENRAENDGRYIVAFLDGYGKATLYVIVGSEQYTFANANYTYDKDGNAYTLSDTTFVAVSGIGTAEEVATAFGGYKDMVFRTYTRTSADTFAVSDGNANKTYTFDKDGKTYTAVLDGFGSATVTQRGADEGTSQRYLFVGGYTANATEYKFMYLDVDSDNLYCLRVSDGSAVTVELYADYLNRIKAQNGETLVIASDNTAAVIDSASKLLVTGTVTAGTGNGVYNFTADGTIDNDLAAYANFTFKKSLADGFFYLYDASEVTNDGGLVLDGYGTAQYDGGEYSYVISTEGETTWVTLGKGNSAAYRLQIVRGSKNTFVAPDSLTGGYYSWQLVDGQIVEGGNYLTLDGYGNATLYTVNMYGNFAKAADGTYVVNADGTATVTFTTEGYEAFTFKKSVRYIGSTLRYAYVPQNADLALEFTTESGEKVVVDSYGEAVFTQNGTSQNGYIVKIADPLFETNTLYTLRLYTASGTGVKSDVYAFCYDGKTTRTIDLNNSAYGSYQLYEGGKVKSDTILIDWFGNVTLTTTNGTQTGTLQATGNDNEYRFVPTDSGAQSFVFTLFTVRSGNSFSGYSYSYYYKVLTERYVASLASSQWATITLDGYNLATVATIRGAINEASYLMLTDAMLRLYFADGTYMYFTVDIDNKTFEVIDDEFITDGNTLIAYNGSNSVVTLPDNITEIAERAFYGTSVTKVDLNNVTVIGEYAFSQCKQLTDIDLSKVTTLGNYAFYGCYALANIDLPAQITKLPVGAFYDCVSLTTVGGMDKLTDIGAYAFARCISLETVKLDSVKTIGAYAFAQCFNLHDVTTGASLTEVGAYAFAVCGNGDGMEFVWTLNSASVPTAGGYMLQSTGGTGCKVVVADVAAAVEFAKRGAWSAYASYITTSGEANGTYNADDGTVYTLAAGNQVLADGTFVGYYDISGSTLTLYLTANSYEAQTFTL